LVLIAFKVAAVIVHRKVDTYYKYRTSDTERLLFERLNERVGICLGLANATVYVFLLSVVAYVFGYFTFQVATSEKDSAGLRMVNNICRDLEKSGMSKAIAPFVPAAKTYYDGADLLGLIYHNPLAAQSRLSSYPAFLALADKKEFKTLGDDVKFQQFWLEGHSFGELLGHEKIQPLIGSIDLYTNAMGLLQGDLKDLKEYVETGVSAKYDEQKILGKWSFEFRESFARARRTKPNMTLQELRATRFALSQLGDATLTAMIDNRATLRTSSTNLGIQIVRGIWKDSGGAKYSLSLSDATRKWDAQAAVEGSKLLVTKDGYSFVFEK